MKPGRRFLDRRTFLKGLGIGAAGLSILPSNVTRAADPTAPRRLIAFFTGNGTIAPSWATAGGSETTFTLGEILQPLAPFKNKLILLDGLDNDASYLGPGAAHQKGCGGWLTGMPLLDGSFSGGNGEQSSGWAAGPSIDQVIAKELGGDTPLRSLELGVQVEGSNNRHRIAYAAKDQPLPPDDDPESVFDRLFAGFTGDPGAAERVNRRRQSVLNFVKGDLGMLKQKLGKTETERLDAHLAAVGDLENKLEMLQGKTCAPPTIDPALDPKSNKNYEVIGQMQMDLLAAAFSCDITRYATILWGGATSGKTFPWLGFDERHHELSHAGDSDTVAKGKLVKINNWYAKQFAYLLAKLDALPEGDGTTVLDNSVVLWGSELAIGNTHSRKGVHWVMAGSGGGAFKTGRYLKYAGDPHNNLLVSIANAMGLSLTTFGNPDNCTGALSKLG